MSIDIARAYDNFCDAEWERQCDAEDWTQQCLETEAEREMVEGDEAFYVWMAAQAQDGEYAVPLFLAARCQVTDEQKSRAYNICERIAADWMDYRTNAYTQQDIDRIVQAANDAARDDYEGDE